MPLWGKNDATSNSVIWAPVRVNKTPNSANRDALYGNTTVSAFVPNAVFGVFAVSATEAANTVGEGKKVAHAGWVLRKVGTGSILTITISAGGTGYSNTDLVKVASPTGGVNAAATLSTNSTGGIATLTISNTGSGFISVNPTVSVTNSTGGASAGSGATLVATAGGRAGRVHYETLVATGQIIGDAAAGADDAILPGT